MITLALLPLLLCSGILFVDARSTKKGVVHTPHDYICGDFDALTNYEWWYDYTQGLEKLFRPAEENCTTPVDGSKHVPMIWGARWGIPTISENSEYVLGFNEPNHKAQANMTAEEACRNWPEVMEKAGSRSIVSPSPTRCGANCIVETASGWFSEFFQLCPNNNITYIAAHVYICDIDDVMDYLEVLYKNHTKLIWLTEVACANTEHEFVQKLFMQKLFPRLEKAHYIFRYSWYKARQRVASYDTVFVTDSVSLLKSDAPELTDLGKWFQEYDGSTKEKLSDISAYDFNEQPTPVSEWLGIPRDEVMLVLRTYTVNAMVWWPILGPFKWNLSAVPASSQAFYITADNKQQKKKRIKNFFNTIMCATSQERDEIDDAELWAEVDRIKALPFTTKKGLKIPKKCK